MNYLFPIHDIDSPLHRIATDAVQGIYGILLSCVSSAWLEQDSIHNPDIHNNTLTVDIFLSLLFLMICLFYIPK